MRLIIQNEVPEHQLAWLEINIARCRQQCHLNSYSEKFQMLPTSLLLVSTVQQKVEGLAQFSMKRSRGDKAHSAGLWGKHQQGAQPSAAVQTTVVGLLLRQPIWTIASGFCSLDGLGVLSPYGFGQLTLTSFSSCKTSRVVLSYYLPRWLRKSKIMHI